MGTLRDKATSRRPRKRKGAARDEEDGSGGPLVRSAKLAAPPSTSTPSDSSAPAPDNLLLLEARATQLLARCIVGREQPSYLNRAVVVPTGYVPSSSSSVAEVTRRHRGDGSDESQVLESSPTPSAAHPAPDAEGRSVRFAIRVEAGVQLTQQGLLCPFLVHQRTPLRPFVHYKDPTAYFFRQVGAGSLMWASSTEESSEVGAAMKEREPRRSALDVVHNAIVVGQQLGEERKLTTVMSAAHHNASATVAKGLLGKAHRLRGGTMVPDDDEEAGCAALSRGLEDYMLLDCEVRVGTVGLGPLSIWMVPPGNLSDRQREYASRFQLLTNTDAPAVLSSEPVEGATVNEDASALSPADTDAAADDPNVAHVVSDLVVSVVDPYLDAASFRGLMGTMLKMSHDGVKSKRKLVRFARVPAPTYQLVFQRRSAHPLGTEASRDETASTSASPSPTSSQHLGAEGGAVLVLESTDNGKSWVEVGLSKGLGSVTSPILNGKGLCLEAVITGKRICKCSSVVSDWASYFLKCLVTRTADRGAASGSQTRMHASVAPVPEVGYVHAESKKRAAEFKLLRDEWQLVSLERILHSLTSCAPSDALLTSIARSAEARGLVDDAPIAPEPLAGTCSLLLTSHLHTKTLFVDDGVSFVRGATCFRRRVTMSNDQLNRQLASVALLDPDGTRPCAAVVSQALHSVIREGTAVLATLHDQPKAGDIVRDVHESLLPVYCFLDEGGAVDAAETSETARDVPQTSLALRRHALFLHQLATLTLPTMDLAIAASTHEYLPWEVMRYPVALGSFPMVTVPWNVPYDPAVSTCLKALASEAAPQVDAALLRDQGRCLVLGLARRCAESWELTEQSETLTVPRTLAFSRSRLLGLAVGMKQSVPARAHLLRAVDEPVAAPHGEGVNEAPVFVLSFDHTHPESFATERSIRDVLPRMLGEASKTCISALCFSDHPSHRFASLDGYLQERVQKTVSPLGTCMVASLALNSRDAAKSTVESLSDSCATPLEQEAVVQRLLQRLLVASSHRQAQVAVQSTVVQNARGPEPVDYRVDVVPEDVLDVFRRVEQSPLLTQGMDSLESLLHKAHGMATGDTEALGEAKLSRRALSLRQAHSRDIWDVPAGARELVDMAVDIGRIISAPTSGIDLTELLESKTRGNILVATLALYLEQQAPPEAPFAQCEVWRPTKGLSRGLTRVVFAEDRHYRAERVEGLPASQRAAIPPMHVVHRVVHDVSSGPDGLARYESIHRVLFTFRDPNVIIGSAGDAVKAKAMLEATRGPASAHDTQSPLVLEQVFQLLRHLGRWGLDTQFASPVVRKATEFEGRSSSGESVREVIRGWLQSRLAAQAANVLAMVQGDETLAQHPLIQILVSASQRTSARALARCREEVLHWVEALAEKAAILTLDDLESAYLHRSVRRHFKVCGIPLEIIPNVFHSFAGDGELEEAAKSVTGRNYPATSAARSMTASVHEDAQLSVLPCDTYCRFTQELVLDVNPSARASDGEVSMLVPVLLPERLEASDGLVLPAGSVALVGNASPDMINNCSRYFGDVVDLHQIGNYLLVPATTDLQIPLGVSLSHLEDPIWRSPLEFQFSRLKTNAGRPVVYRRENFYNFQPLRPRDTAQVYQAAAYAVPRVGEPLYKKGKFAFFHRGNSPHSFFSAVLRRCSMVKAIKYTAKH